mgnify:CR=1 FL=1
MALELEGKVAIVTGSSSGIGEETARRLSALGAKVVVNSSSSVEAGEAVVILREVCRHPVQNDTKSALVCLVDEIAELIRRSVA